MPGSNAPFGDVTPGVPAGPRNRGMVWYGARQWCINAVLFCLWEKACLGIEHRTMMSPDEKLSLKLNKRVRFILPVVF